MGYSLGPEILPEGKMSQGGWVSGGGATLEYVQDELGALVLQATRGTAGWCAVINIGDRLVNGKTYRISGRVKSGTPTADVTIVFNGTNLETLLSISPNWKYIQKDVVYDSAQPNQIACSVQTNTGEIGLFDDISIRQVKQITAGKHVHDCIFSYLSSLYPSDETVAYMPLEKDLVDATGVNGTGTFKRNSTAWYRHRETGLLTQAAIDEPRFEKNGLLLENSSENIHDQFVTAYPTIIRGSKVANAVISPDGNMNANRFVENTDNNSHYMSRSFAQASISDNAIISHSVFVKAGVRKWVALGIRTKQPDFRYAYFNLETGTLHSLTLNFAVIEDWGNGWFRIGSAFNVGTGVEDPQFNLYAAVDDGFNVYEGDGESGFYFFGLQVESFFYPTSPIYTDGASGVRGEEATNYSYTRGTTWTMGQKLIDALAETLGTDVVVNGGFDTDANWTKTGSWSIAGGVASTTGAIAGNLYQNVFTPLTTYKVEFTINSISGGSLFFGSGNEPELNLSFDTVGNKILYFTPRANTNGNLVFTSGAGVAAEIDNVKAQPVNSFSAGTMYCEVTPRFNYNRLTGGDETRNIVTVRDAFNSILKARFTSDGLIGSRCVFNDVFSPAINWTYNDNIRMSVKWGLFDVSKSIMTFTVGFSVNNQPWVWATPVPYSGPFTLNNNLSFLGDPSSRMSINIKSLQFIRHMSPVSTAQSLVIPPKKAIPDLLLEHWKAQGATGPHRQEAERQFLVLQGVTETNKHTQDMWVEYISGLTGAPSSRDYNDLWYWYWCTYLTPADLEDLTQNIANGIENEGWMVLHVEETFLTIQDVGGPVLVTIGDILLCEFTQCSSPLRNDLEDVRTIELGPCP